MTSLLVIESSPPGEQSVSRRITRELIAKLRMVPWPRPSGAGTI